MGLAIGLLVGAAVLVVVLRQWMLSRECPPRPAQPFDADVYPVGKAAIIERRGDNPRTTVICMHGFVSDMRYFVEHYKDPSIQLILLMSCDYHVPISSPRFKSASWAKTPSAPEGTIPYDAAVLVQALEHLPRTDRVRVHGHSRGGAVILEAASLRPDLFARVEVILEAPVLPQGKPYASVSAMGLWLMAFVMPLWRREPISQRNLKTWGPLENALKREHIMGFPFNPKRTSTTVANMRNIGEWMKGRDHTLFQNIKQGTLLVPGKDRVLDTASMLASAQKAGPHIQVVQLEGCSHFPLFDCPSVIPPLEVPAERPAASSAT